jgi:SEC-C motif-containing protein
MQAQLNPLCPCDCNTHYEQCCAQFHQGRQQPKTALELMKSRYSAYAKAQAVYIINTTHKTHQEYLDDVNVWFEHINEFIEITQFRGLNIIDYQEFENEAYVIFQALLTQHGVNSSFTERSHFVKENGIWYYQSGEIFDEI